MAVSIPRPAMAGMVVFFLAAAYNANEIGKCDRNKGELARLNRHRCHPHGRDANSKPLDGMQFLAKKQYA